MSDLLSAQTHRHQPRRTYQQSNLMGQGLRLMSQVMIVGVGILAMLPILYLVMRALDADTVMLNYLLSSQGLAVIGRSLGLMGAVMAGTLLIGIPFAWLTSRTDLPLRRIWFV